MNKVHLVVIDPQNDFCHPKGALYVPGAEEDMGVRLPKFIRRNKKKLADIHVTLDSHHKVDIAHPIFWRDSSGNRPDPFTIISTEDVEKGKWTTAVPSFYKRALEYVRSLEKNGRYPLCIWPEHCLIGSWGHNVVTELFQALLEWEDEFAVVNYVTKGSNLYTEHYSAVQADVPDPSDPSTQINTDFINTLVNEADILAIAGEASSHCVANTVRDIVNNFSDPQYIQKVVLLTDAMSPVSGFEKLEEEFLAEMKADGMKMSTTEKFLS